MNSSRRAAAWAGERDAGLGTGGFLSFAGAAGREGALPPVRTGRAGVAVVATGVQPRTPGPAAGPRPVGFLARPDARRAASACGAPLPHPDGLPVRRDVGSLRS
ncbi:hypothetical protein GCM10010504_37410 [Streptomyces griseus]|nr:hypothetical protein GCM10010504_37410 [Streptomyces griseus]